MIKSFCILLCYLCPAGLLAQWTTSGSNIYNSNSGNVGIGTNSPASKLIVSNAGNNGFEIDPVTDPGGGTGIISYNRSNSTYTPIQIVGSKFSFGTSSILDAMVMLNNGNVGIGNSAPGISSPILCSIKS